MDQKAKDSGDEDLNGEKGFRSAVPYLMVLFTISMMGFLFIVTVCPLIVDLLGHGDKYKDFKDLMKLAVVARYKSVVVGPGPQLTPILGLVFTALPAGFLVQQLSGTIAYGVAQVWNNLAGVLNERKKKDGKVAKVDLLFSAEQFKEPGHGDFKIWLLEHRSCKLEWEWEFVNYCFYWGLFTIITCFFGLSFMLVKSPPWLLWLTGTLAVLFLLVHAINRSQTMRLVHDACVRKAHLSPATRTGG